MKKNILLFILAFTSLSLFSQTQLDTFLVFYLGGQSNMDGYGYNKDIPASMHTKLADVMIFHGNTLPDGKENGGKGIWSPVKAGHGRGFSSDGMKNKYSDRFGLEMSFAYRIKELLPGKKIAIIKYSRGGTSIDSLAAGRAGCWEPDMQGKNGINQYDHFLSTLRNAFQDKDIDNNGTEDLLLPSGILWMQGESDASYSEEIAMRYHANLKRLMDLIRASLHKDDLPVVIGKISDSWNNDYGKVWKYGELIQHAQEKYVRTDSRATIVRQTRYYKYSDPWHYDSEGYLDLGRKMAEAIQPLLLQP